jgi:hypothetical protein
MYLYKKAILHNVPPKYYVLCFTAQLHNYEHSGRKNAEELKIFTICNKVDEHWCSYLLKGNPSFSNALYTPDILFFLNTNNQLKSYSKTNKTQLFHKLFIFMKHSTCYRRSFLPSSGTQDCTYSNRHMSNSCCCCSCLTCACCCMCSLELLMIDGKTVRNMYNVSQI